MSEIDSLKIVIEAEDRVSGVISGISDNINNLNRSTGNNSKSIKNIGADIKSIGNDIDAVTKPLQYAAVGSVAAGVAVSKAAMDYETAFTKVKKTVNASDEEFKQIDADIKKLSSDIPVNAAELANLAGVGGQLGVGAKDITKFTRVMADMSVATNLAGENGATALARLINVTGESMDNVDRVGSSIVALGNNTATTEAEIAEMAQRMGKFGNTVGMNISQVLGYSAALSSMGVEAQAGGSAMGRVWLQIEKDIANNTEYLQTYAKYAGTTADEFKKKWNTDPSGAFNGLIKGLSATEDLTVALGEMGIENTLDQQAVIALANNYEMLEKCLNLSSEAYQQNTALTKEATTAYGTARNQIKMALNDITTAAVKWGDVLLPEIKSGAEWVGNIAQKFGDLDAGTKNAVISGAKAAIVMGGVSKATAATVKNVGGFLEGVSNIKKSVAPGGALFKLAPTLTKAAAAAGPVALGIAGVGAAVLVAKKAYDSYENAQLNASKRALEYSQSTIEAVDNLKELSNLQEEYKSLTSKLEKGGLSSEEADSTKARLDEIKKLLSEKYKVDLDSTDIDFAIEKAKKLAELKALQDKDKTVKELNNAENADDVTKRINQNERLSKSYDEQTLKVADTRTEVEKLRQAYNDLSYEEQQLQKADYASKLNKAMQDAGFKGYNNDEPLIDDASYLLESEFKHLEKLAKDLQGEIEKDEEALNNTKQAALNLADVGFAEIKRGSIQQGLDDIALAVEKGGLAVDEYAMKATVAQNSLSSFSELAGKSPETFQKVATDYQNAAKQFGASGTEIAVGLALIQNGFDNIQQAANAGMLDSVSQQATEIARSMGELSQTQSITIKFNKDSSEIDGYKAEDKDGKVVYSVVDSEVQSYNPPNFERSVTYTVKTVLGSNPSGAFKNFGLAKGTQNFSGGLAMVNDETGVSDPRELIIDKGKVFIPQGKNVILPLSKGAKVYTASQTKRIMSGLGIPHYASGKDNSDAFISAKDDWTHYTKTHAVTVTEELSKWNAFSKQFTSNLKDAADIEEQIFSLIQKTRTEQNEASEAYIMNRAEMNDWEAWGDSAIDAFSRVRKREYEYVEAGKITIEAADKYLISLGENMYQKRIANSKEWLDREVEYHNMNTEQYMAGLDRMEAYTKEYYANGILAGEEYYKGMQELAYMRIDKEREENNRIYDDWKNSAEGYKEQRDLYGDWNEFGDSPIQFYERCKERQKEFFEQGIIDWETYNAAIIDYDMELYKAQSNALDDMLDAQSKYIDEVSSKYDDMIDKLDYEYEMKNLRLDLTDAVKNESIYKGAVTQKGKDKYTEYSKQIDELGHQIEMKTLQKEQNDTVAALRADYEVMEKGKSLALKGLNAQCIDIDALTRIISGNTSSMQSLVEDIVDLIRNLDVGNKVTYGNTTLNIDAGDADISSFIKRATNALGG